MQEFGFLRFIKAASILPFDVFVEYKYQFFVKLKEMKDVQMDGEMAE